MCRQRGERLTSVNSNAAVNNLVFHLELDRFTTMRLPIRSLGAVHRGFGSTQTSRRARRQRSNRRGTVMVLLAVLLPVLAILAAFCVNAAQMQLTRTELMVATDAAARAGGRAFSEEQTTLAARQAAQATGLLNQVNGSPLQIRLDEIQFGEATQGDSGKYDFAEMPLWQVDQNLVVANAVQVEGNRDEGSLGGVIPFVFPSLFSISSFEPKLESVAMQVDRDISLVVDRSGSMDWLIWPEGVDPFNWDVFDEALDADILGYNWWGQLVYASGENRSSFERWAWDNYYEYDDPFVSKWTALQDAVDAFLAVLDDTPQSEQVGVASYSTTGSRDSWLDEDFDTSRNAIDGLSATGATAIGLGMREGIKHFDNAAARPFASKTMVVMTDGNHNEGEDPVDAAEDFAGTYNLTIHTVTFGSDANETHMLDVANACNGKHYHAETGAQLTAVFQEIANNLPTILTK